jgi:hypothetical protein
MDEKSRLLWTNEMDRRLLRGVERGLSRGQMAKELGVSRSAAIARYHRLQGIVFQSDRKRLADSAKQARERKRRRAEIAAEMASKLARRIRSGMSRYEASHLTMQEGASLELIAGYFGVTRQAIHHYQARYAQMPRKKRT